MRFLYLLVPDSPANPTANPTAKALDKCGGEPVPLPWTCCRRPTTAFPVTPAPERIAKSYPHPPAARPAPGKASVILIFTDDQDKMLG